MEIILIVIIIAVIFMFLSGGFPLMTADYGEAHQRLAASQYKCEQVVWTTAPQVTDSLFDGTMELRCQFEAVAGVGMIELRKHMLAKLPASAEKIHSGPSVENFEGLPSNAWDLTLRMKAKNETVLVRGKTHVATNGFTQIRNVFESTETPTRGAAKYLKGVRSEVSVEATDRPNWYNIRIISQSKVEKPWFISAGKFRAALVEKSEEQFNEKAIDMMTEIAHHL
jgi:hypothetical protein